LQRKIIQELVQEAAGRQREAPVEMVVKDHRLLGLRSGDSLAVGRTAAHEIYERKHSTLA
jgi:hypothetical protein